MPEYADGCQGCTGGWAVSKRWVVMSTEVKLQNEIFLAELVYIRTRDVANTEARLHLCATIRNHNKFFQSPDSLQKPEPSYISRMRSNLQRLDTSEAAEPDLSLTSINSTPEIIIAGPASSYSVRLRA